MISKTRISLSSVFYGDSRCTYRRTAAKYFRSDFDGRSDERGMEEQCTRESPGLYTWLLQGPDGFFSR